MCCISWSVLGPQKKHAFVFVDFAGATWDVEGYLTGDMNYAPTLGPDLPFPLTGGWLVYQTGRRGVRWDGNTWLLFEAR